MKKAFLGALAVLFAGACYGQQTPVVILTSTNAAVTVATPISPGNPLPVYLTTGSAALPSNVTITGGTVSALLTGTQGVVVSAAVSTGTTTFTAGVRKIDMYFSNPFAGTLVVGGTLSLTPLAGGAYTYQTPLANSSPQVLLVITSGTAGTVSFY